MMKLFIILIFLFSLSYSKGDQNETTILNTETTTTDEEMTTTILPLENTIDASSRSPQRHYYDRSLFKDGPFCLCDLTTNECDINCCCDDECSYHDLSSFDSNCAEREKESGRYCYSTKSIVLSNNSRTTVIKNSDDLLCIVVNNVPELNQFEDKVPTDNLTIFNSLKSRHRSFQWKIETSESIFRSESYVFGDPIYVVVDHGYDIFYLIDDIPIKYMSEGSFVHSRGLIKAESIPKSVVADPKNPEQIVDINMFICEDHEDHEDCRRTDPRNVKLKTLRYEITHAGIDGIKEITAIFKPASKDDTFTRLSYRHIWWKNSTEDIVDKVRRLSGNPGYIIGKPLVAGEIMTGLNKVSVKEFDRGLQFYGFFPNGRCDDVNRRLMSLKFQQNMRVGCLLPSTLTCLQLKNESETLYRLNSTNLQVGVFGNADPNVTEDWVNVIFTDNFKDDTDDCSYVRSLNIEILYANVGPFIDPQAKIIGVNYRYIRSVNLKMNNYVEFSTSVIYVDISQPAEEKFAEYPVIEAKFPHDFFYPFFMSSSQVTISSPMQMSGLILLAIFINRKSCPT